MASTTRANEVSGTLRVHYRGFGFVEPDDRTASIFCPMTALDGLLDGDVVTARVSPTTGKLLRLTRTRRTRTVVVGEVAVRGGTATLTVDPAIGSLSTPLKGAETVPAGTCVVATLGPDSATVTEVLGDPLDPQVLARRVMARHQLPATHDDETLKAAAALRGRTPRRNPRQRDLVDQLVITIDDDSSADLDDALAAAPARNGGIRVWVHIADVAMHVEEGGVLDRAAQAVPTSVYLPTGVRHMLPDGVSADRLSLLPEQQRDAVTVELLVDSEGNVSSVDVYESRIRSRRRLNYDTVGRIIHTGTADTVDGDVTALVAMLWAAASRLGQARAVRGGVDAFRADPEPAGTRGSDEAHLLVERLMVASNEAVAAWLDQRSMPGLYRVHPALTDEEADELELTANALGLYASLPRPVTPRAMAALAAAAAPTAHAAAFWRATLKLLGRASYQAEPGLHFGLGSQQYLHFTSPLRRYADLQVHRIVKAFLAGERDLSMPNLPELAAHITDVSRRADHAERDMDRALALLQIPAGETVNAVMLSARGRNGRAAVGDVIGQLTCDRDLTPGQTVRARVVAADPLTGRFELAVGKPSTARTSAKAPADRKPAKARNRSEQRPKRRPENKTGTVDTATTTPAAARKTAGRSRTRSRSSAAAVGSESAARR